METGKPVRNYHHKGGCRKNPNIHTLCWDCANASNSGCPWSDNGEPVPGWNAKKTIIKFAGEGQDSYHVFNCPMFKRDAERGGREPLGGGKNNDKGDGDGQSTASYALYRMALIPDSGGVGSGVRSVASRKNERTRVLSEAKYTSKELIDLGFGIIERAVNDWKMLDFGLKEEVFDGRDGYIKRKDIVIFFFSKWFTRLCEPLHYSPEEIRNALNIPEDAMLVLSTKDERRIRGVFERRVETDLNG